MVQRGKFARSEAIPALSTGSEFGERYKDRPGGYTRIIKLGRRAGDGAELAIIELLGNPRETAAEEASKKRTKGGSKKKATESKAAETKDESETEE